MVKINAPRNVSGDTPRVRGAFYIREDKNGPVAVTWPKKRGAAKTPGAYYQEAKFQLAGRMASSAIAEDVGTAIEMAKGTEQVPRDIITMCIFGTYYELENEDGFVWPVKSKMTANPQYTLDAVTNTPGSILYRAEDGWFGLDPGDNGQVLTMVDGLPEWQPAGGGGSSGPLVTTLVIDNNMPVVNTTLFTATFDRADLDECDVWDPATPTRLYIPPTCTRYRLSASILMGTANTATYIQIRTPRQDGVYDFPGGIFQETTRSTNSTSTKRVSAVGPWVARGTIDYVELQYFQNFAQNQNFRANTSFTLEAVF